MKWDSNKYKPVQSASRYPMLPAGAYVAGVKDARIEGTDPDECLILRLEIVEGEFANYFSRRYSHESANASFSNQYQTTYKGDFRVQLPNPNNTRRQHPEWDESHFNHMLYCFEKSNPDVPFLWEQINNGGYVFLKGKYIGISVREGTFNDNPYTKIARLEVAEDVRKGLVKTMKKMDPRYSDGGSQPAAGAPGPSVSGGFTMVETDELPF